MPTEKPTYKVGKAIKLWDTVGMGEAWSFSYHRPDGVEIWDYRLTLETYPTKEAAIDRCANFVWNMNRTLYGGL